MTSPTPDVVFKTILIVDDDEVLGRSLARQCEELGFKVRLRSDTAGLTSDDFEPFDVVILDLMMPNLDGIEILRLLGDCKRKPALIPMSGLGGKLLNSATQLAQFHGLKVLGELQKPFKPSDVNKLFPTNAPETIAPLAQLAQVPDGVTVTASDIERAISKHEFVVYFQPQIRLMDASWIGVEALVRWQHPVHGLLGPDTFVPLAETSHLARRFTFEVIGQAIAGVKALERDAHFRGKLSVNFPPVAMDDVNIPEELQALLAEMDFPAKRLTLEVTETSLPQAVKVSLDVQARLALRGIGLSIDDFGTGHSSLERLSDSPFSELKIDLMFVSRLDDNEAARRIVENAISLGQNLNMTVAAEGVETESQYEWLKAHGCQSAQGYFISPPTEVAGVVQWAKTWRPGLATAGAQR